MYLYLIADPYVVIADVACDVVPYGMRAMWQVTMRYLKEFLSYSMLLFTFMLYPSLSTYVFVSAVADTCAHCDTTCTT